jgi:hypothetical protein
VPPQKILSTLLDSHCPGSHAPNKYEPGERSKAFVAPRAWRKIVTDKTVRKAVDKFAARKAPGPDGIRPCHLKNLPANAISRLASIIKMSIELSHIPKCWTESTVVFIPKPGKRDKSDPRSYRPITLMSFLMKTMERVILWALEKLHFNVSPQIESQHAFRLGKGCDSALCETVDYIESATAIFAGPLIMSKWNRS